MKRNNFVRTAIDRDLKEKLDAYCSSKDRSISYVLRTALKKYLTETVQDRVAG